MRSKLIGQSAEYNMLYEILRKTERITRMAPHIGWYSPSTGPIYSSEYESVLSRAAVLGYGEPNENTSIALNSFLQKRVIDGSYAVLDTLHITALNNASLSNFARLNYITPTLHELNPVGSPTYDTSGFNGNGTTAYLEVYNPSIKVGAKYVRDSASRGIFRSIAGATNAIEGITSGNNNAIFGADSTNTRINGGTNLLNISVNMSGAGYRGINRSSSSNVQCYVEVTKFDRTQTSAAVESQIQVIFRRGANFSNGNCQLYFMGGSLTETQHNNMRNDFLVFKTAIGL